MPLECRVYFGSFACAYDDGSAAADDDDVPGSSAGIPDQRMHVRRDSQTMWSKKTAKNLEREFKGRTKIEFPKCLHVCGGAWPLI